MTKIKRFGWSKQDFYAYIMWMIDYLAEKEVQEIRSKKPR